MATAGSSTSSSPDGYLMAVSIETQPVFRPGTPRKLFQLPERPDRDTPIFEDVTPDGQRFLLNVPVTARSSVGFHVILNWPSLLDLPPAPPDPEARLDRRGATMLDVLYRDDDVVAVHKPPGLMVHRSLLDRRETRFAVQLLRAQLGRRVFPAHRLDRGTSGVLLLAFDSRVAARLGQAFESRAVAKRYLAVVRGWPEPSGSIEHPLRRLEDGKDAGDPDAPRQEARTDYRRLACAEVPIPSERHDRTRVALLELLPLTGRQHQIRRHLKHISHPVIGDAT